MNPDTLSFPSEVAAQIVALSGRCANLERKVEGQAKRILQLERVVGSDGSSSHLSDLLTTALALTKEIFGDAVECCEDEDAELAGDRFIRFTVRPRGQISELLAKSNEWHRRVAELPIANKGLFRLSMNPQDD